MIDGVEHHFSAAGLYNGLVLLMDDETGSYWDHMTGEAVHGPLKGHRLDQWPLHHTTVAAALAEHPGVPLHRVPMRNPIGFAMRMMQHGGTSKRSYIPPPFRKTMGEADARLGETVTGLGVVVDGRARFYPMSSLSQPVEEDWGGRAMHVGLGPIDGSPRAIWADDGSRPMQLLSRWYGFSYTYPDCEIHGTLP